MDKLNTLLIVMVAVAITAPFVMSHNAHAIQPVQMEVNATQEVSQEVYRAIYMVAQTCDIETELRAMLDGDNKISYIEAENIGSICEADAIAKATQPFSRGRIEQELKYIKKGGVAM